MNASVSNFFETLPPITAFENAQLSANFHPLPEAWTVVCTDVEESTKAIASGRYRGVTMIGAACIIAARNAAPTTSLAYTFGGDGATICVPPEALQPVLDALLGMKILAQREHQLTLRVGAVPMRDIAAAGRNVLVAKYRPAGKDGKLGQALFAGGGISFAETEIKTVNSPYLVALPPDASATSQPNLNGLECRWEDVRSSGKTLSVIIEALSETKQSETFATIQHRIFEIFSNSVECNPIQRESLQLSFRPEKLLNEIKLKNGRLSPILRTVLATLLSLKSIVGSVLLTVCERSHLTLWSNYRQSVSQNTDFLKFADGFKLVLRSTNEQHQLLQNYLESLWQSRQAVYGIHVSPGALITCLVVNRTDSHFHFVDGDDGGLTLAAKELKSRKATYTKSEK